MDLLTVVSKEWIVAFVFGSFFQKKRKNHPTPNFFPLKLIGGSCPPHPTQNNKKNQTTHYDFPVFQGRSAASVGGTRDPIFPWMGRIQQVGSKGFRLKDPSVSVPGVFCRLSRLKAIFFPFFSFLLVGWPMFLGLNTLRIP